MCKRQVGLSGLELAADCIGKVVSSSLEMSQDLRQLNLKSKLKRTNRSEEIFDRASARF